MNRLDQSLLHKIQAINIKGFQLESLLAAQLFVTDHLDGLVTCPSICKEQQYLISLLQAEPYAQMHFTKGRHRFSPFRCGIALPIATSQRSALQTQQELLEAVANMDAKIPLVRIISLKPLDLLTALTPTQVTAGTVPAPLLQTFTAQLYGRFKPLTHGLTVTSITLECHGLISQVNRASTFCTERQPIQRIPLTTPWPTTPVSRCVVQEHQILRAPQVF